MPTTALGATMAGPSMSRQPMSEYEQAEHNNFNLSLNQILRVPYQIVMPPTEINQSISINNLPSLNDLAIRTGINTGMGTIFTQRPMAAPSPVPLTTQQLAILPLSSLYPNCSKDHLQLPIPILEDRQKYQAQYYKQGEIKMPSLMPNIIARNTYNPNPPYLMGDRGKGSYCFSSMDNK